MDRFALIGPSIGMSLARNNLQRGVRVRRMKTPSHSPPSLNLLLGFSFAEHSWKPEDKDAHQYYLYRSAFWIQSSVNKTEV